MSTSKFAAYRHIVLGDARSLAYWWLTGVPTLRLTKPAVAALALPPGKREVLFFDSELAGFGVKVSAGGSRRYVLQYRPTGQRTAKRLTIGSVGVLSVDEARRQAKTLLARAATGDDPHAGKATAKAQAAITLGSVADAYLKHCEHRQRPGTLYQTTLHLTKHWAPLRPLPLHNVTRAAVAARLNELRESSGGVSANRSRSALSALFAWAIAEGRAEINPVTGTRQPATETPRERVLTDDELRAIWRACREDAYGQIVRLLILTAQRRDEVGGMVASEVSFEGSVWTLPAARAKNKREQVVPLAPFALSILQAVSRRDGGMLMFSPSDRGFSAWSGSKARLDKRLADAGTPVAAWTIHDLRRTAATGMAGLGVLPHVVEAVLNHVSGHKAGVARVYNKATYLPEKRDALDRWANYVAALVA